MTTLSSQLLLEYRCQESVTKKSQAKLQPAFLTSRGAGLPLETNLLQIIF